MLYKKLYLHCFHLSREIRRWTNWLFKLTQEAGLSQAEVTGKE